MKKILSLVLVLMLCAGMVAMAESVATEAPTEAPTSEPTKIPSPTVNPTAQPDPTRTAAPTRTPAPARTAAPSDDNGDVTEPTPTLAPTDEIVEIEIIVEGATVVVAPEAEINALIANLKAAPTAMFTGNQEVLFAVAGRNVLGATIAKIEFDTLSGADVPFKTKAPAGMTLKEGDNLIVVVGVMVNGVMVYQPVLGTVKDGNIELAFPAELAQSINASAQTQLMFFA